MAGRAGVPERAASGRRASIALCLSLSASVFLAGCNPAKIPAGEVLPIAVETQVIDALGGAPVFADGLSFIGGLELSSPEPLFGAFSSIRFLDEDRFLGVFDTGYWITGRIVRNGDQHLSGVTEVSLAPLLDPDGAESGSKFQVDAESLAIEGGSRAHVGFEQRHRVITYQPISDLGQALPSAPLPLPFDARRLRGNGGIEALIVAPPAGPLAGALVAISEKTVDEEGNLIAGILGGPLAGEFRVRPRDGFEVTDGAFLADGDLLLLERRFSIASGVAMRLRRIEGDTLRPQAVVDGDILFEADNRSQIDNMEGMDVLRAADGSMRLIVVSDDNHSILQRTLMLEFKLDR
ncbi:esterase-like activity of phytase family protein [Rhizobium sp. AAP43]|uniref:esterase-like activity of phytase family protein n=1 Tax=Rhizobium sp. AAP43 TaxID=1523420 RepID=UPI0009E97CA4|nr:esterase-like activity of phytase family protein [Rhizobium sp. AAP43]